MESHDYPHLQLTFHVALFRDISNASELLAQLVHTSTLPATPEGDSARHALNFAFIDAAMVTSRLAVWTACYQACLAMFEGELRTRTVHSEVLWCFSPGPNITDALRRFGLSASTKDLVVVQISPVAPPNAPPDDSNLPSNIEARMRAVAKGQPGSLDDLADVTDWSAVRKVYKLNSDPSLTYVQKSDLLNEKKEKELRRVVDETVISLIAMKSVANI